MFVPKIKRNSKRALSSTTSLCESLRQPRDTSGNRRFAYKGTSKSGLAAFPFSVRQAESGTVRFPIEQSGPGGEYHVASSNRAKLRAMIAGLEFREWQEEGWKRIIVARWLASWVKRRWKTRKARQVANRDLWEELHGVIHQLAHLGTEVSFWLIPARGTMKHSSSLIQETKDIAREAATSHFDTSAD
ncbi:hypothetical protein GGR55DRAFT_677431 [Xylaria sp. FL0064]|nr:hypothetical protein GGR55DRAFT_677431 [Xylaria sp. FL0064]